MAQIAVIVVHVVAALATLTGFWLTARFFIGNDSDGTATIATRGRWAARGGPILIAVGVGLGFIGNIAGSHLPASPASDMVAPSNPADRCDDNDGLFGLCGAGQLR
jgi:hypothetical protein